VNKAFGPLWPELFLQIFLALKIIRDPKTTFYRS